MQQRGESDYAALMECATAKREVKASTQRLAAKADSPDSRLIYDLRGESGDSNRFFGVVSQFADEVLVETEWWTGTLLDRFIAWLRAFRIEDFRSRSEYAIEFVLLGMMLRRYDAAARCTPVCCIRLAQGLLWLRKRSGCAKPLVDAARAILARYVFVPAIRPGSETEAASLERLERLIEWMRATGELEQEALRLKNWQRFLSTLSSDVALHWMKVAVDLFDDFEREAAARLGTYTCSVEPFLASEYAKRGCREDALFCGRAPVEYHLNMVAAEVMNRGLHAGFDRMQKRVVLVPACMRGAKAEKCRARIHGVDMACTACDPECTVNRITHRMRRLGAKVYLVPHSTGFGRWLDRWQRESDVGVTAVACILNILPGGYEMRVRQIPSQCVPLDYPGCKKHWDHIGIPTGVNEGRLVQIATLNPRQSVVSLPR